jgi:hypothetical protein
MLITLSLHISMIIIHTLFKKKIYYIPRYKILKYVLFNLKIGISSLLSKFHGKYSYLPETVLNGHGFKLSMWWKGLGFRLNTCAILLGVYVPKSSLI